MRKFLLSGSIILGVVLTSTAQITITRNDLGNLIGTVIVQGIDSTNLSSLSVGNAGTNQTWNLSGISNDYQDTMQFVNPAGTPCVSDFPTATFAVAGQFGTMYGYDDNSVIEMQGVCGVFMPPDTTTIHITPPQRNLIFPLSYNTYWTDLTKQVMQSPETNPGPPDSIRIVVTTYYSNIVDGWGNVTTPMGTYPSLRLKISKNTVDSTFIYITPTGWQLSGNPTIKNEIAYNWWTNNDFMIAVIKTDSSGTNVTFAQYLVYSNVSGVEDMTVEPFSLLLYPNPAAESFTIVNLTSEAKMLTVTDVLGRQVFETTISKNFINVSTSSFDTGIFFYQVLDNKGLPIHKGKFLVDKQ